MCRVCVTQTGHTSLGFLPVVQVHFNYCSLESCTVYFLVSRFLIYKGPKHYRTSKVEFVIIWTMHATQLCCCQLGPWTTHSSRRQTGSNLLSSLPLVVSLLPVVLKLFSAAGCESKSTHKRKNEFLAFFGVSFSFWQSTKHGRCHLFQSLWSWQIWNQDEKSSLLLL